MALYRRKDSGVWWADISHPKHPRVRESTGTTDHVEAQRVHDQLRAALWARAPKHEERQWSDAVAAWVAIEQRSESELLSLGKFGRHFHDRALRAVEGADVEAALAFCKTVGTFTRYRTMIVAILNVAHKRKWISEVPDIPQRKGKKPTPRKWLTHEEWGRLYAALPAHLKGPAALAVRTGMRQSNVFGLRWKEVDLIRKHAVVESDEAKAGAGIPVALSDEAVETLRSQVGLHHEFVFTYRGRPMAKPKEGFAQAKRAAGLVGFTWHGLRHTWATWHIQNGTPLDVLQKLGGWADIRMVLQYAHHTAGYLASYANNVGERHDKQN